MSLVAPLMQHDAGSASGAPLPHALDFPSADDAQHSPTAAPRSFDPAAVRGGAATQPSALLLPGHMVLLAGLAVMGLGGVAVGVSLALGLGGLAGVGAGVLLMLALVTGLTALIAHLLAQPVRAALRRAESLVRHYSGRPLRAAGDDFTRIDTALDEVCAALQEHAARVRCDHLDELRNSLELQRQYALMRLLRALAAAPCETDGLTPMLGAALREIGHFLDWPLGRVIECTSDGRTRSDWLQPGSGRFAGFIAAVERADQGAAAAGGIGARAAATGMPHWVTSVAEAGEFPGAAEAAAAGLRTAIAIPVLSHGRQVALFEFYADRHVEASAEMIEVVDAVCIEVSRAAEQCCGRSAMSTAPQSRRRSAGKPRGKSAALPASGAMASRSP